MGAEITLMHLHAQECQGLPATPEAKRIAPLLPAIARTCCHSGGAVFGTFHSEFQVLSLLISLRRCPRTWLALASSQPPCQSRHSYSLLGLSDLSKPPGSPHWVSPSNKLPLFPSDCVRSGARKVLKESQCSPKRPWGKVTLRDT
jgi:hypothetical protein